MIAALVATARVLEERVRTSRTLRRIARAALYVASRRSRNVRDFVRIRVRRVV